MPQRTPFLDIALTDRTRDRQSPVVSSTGFASARPVLGLRPVTEGRSCLVGELDFELVYRDHFPFVWRSLRRLGVREAQLDDATQEVFLVVHHRLGDFDGRVPIRSWLFGIARLTSLSYRRRVRKTAADPLPSELGATAATPHDQAETSEAVRFLDAFLETLGEAQRLVFILAELEQMHASEIADTLGVKVNTVYSRLRLARAAFRRAVARRERSEHE